MGWCASRRAARRGFGRSDDGSAASADPALATGASPRSIWRGRCSRTQVAGGFVQLSKLDVFAYAIVCAAVFSQRGDPYHFYISESRTVR